MSTLPQMTSLRDGIDLAHEVLQYYADRELDCWSSVTRGWRTNKRDMISALCPETGQRTVAIAYDPTAHEKRSALHAALTTVYYRYADGPVWRDALLSFRAALTLDLVGKGTIPRESFAADTLGCRVGQKIGRALCALLVKAGADNDSASRAVDEVMSLAKVKPRKGFVTLSVALHDLLFCSENGSYTSCHMLDRCHRAGPQVYLHDSCTAVAYYWEEMREGRLRHALPFKLWRQLVHFDWERDSVLFMRDYGNDAEGAVLAARNALAAAVLERVNWPDYPESAWRSIPWTLGMNDAMAKPEQGTDVELAYIDSPSGWLPFASHGRGTMNGLTERTGEGTGRPVDDDWEREYEALLRDHKDRGSLSMWEEDDSSGRNYPPDEEEK